MSRHRIPDLIGVFRGVQIVANASMKHQLEACEKTIKNSNFKSAAEEGLKQTQNKLKEFDPSKVPVSFEMLSLNPQNQPFFQPQIYIAKKLNFFSFKKIYM